MYPSLRSCENASSTVFRETPRSAANVRVEGKRRPGVSTPSKIICRIRRYVRRCSGAPLASGSSSANIDSGTPARFFMRNR
jgi:hypothetical protein